MSQYLLDPPHIVTVDGSHHVCIRQPLYRDETGRATVYLENTGGPLPDGSEITIESPVAGISFSEVKRLEFPLKIQVFVDASKFIGDITTIREERYALYQYAKSNQLEIYYSVPVQICVQDNKRALTINFAVAIRFPRRIKISRWEAFASCLVFHL